MTAEQLMETDLPLLDLFDRLRNADLPLGIDEYRTLLRALQLGFGTRDEKELRRVCKILWVKSPADEAIFDYHFDRLLKEWEPARRVAETTVETTAMQEPETTQPRADRQRDAGQLKAEPQVTTPPPREQVTAPGDAGSGAQPIQEQDPEKMRELHAALQAREIPLKRFVLAGEYFPVTAREMKQNWRYLRRMVREGPATELDVELTVKKIGRDGVLLEPVLLPERINRTELLLLIDQGGSMVPFHALARRLVETAVGGGRLGRAGVYYFHNVPLRHLYLNSTLSEARAVQQVIHPLRRERTVVMFFSDAGAARGGLNPERIEQTKNFLHALEANVRR
ncbi:MAG: CoxE, partial [Chloroflexi bacterium]|nr:CoxE [Chloroflexota bacterium]